MFGKVSGSSVDWVYDTLKVVDAYGFELRPDINSNYGFLLPEEQVENVGNIDDKVNNVYFVGNC